MGDLGPDHPFPHDVFADVIAANGSYAAAFKAAGLPGHAARGLAILTCIDSRIDALGVVGLLEGDGRLRQVAFDKAPGVLALPELKP